MKKNSSGLFMQLSNNEVVSLTKVVNETVAIGFTPVNRKVFSTADLWNIQRQKKGIGTKRYPF